VATTRLDELTLTSPWLLVAFFLAPLFAAIAAALTYA
jgi:hypothetical protein